MKAGKLRHWGRIEQPSITQNTHGESVTTWLPYAARRPMEVTQTNSRELWYAQQVHPDITCMVKTRYVDGVTANMRVVWEDGNTERILHIGAPPLNPDGKRQELVMMCMERE